MKPIYFILLLGLAACGAERTNEEMTKEMGTTKNSSMTESSAIEETPYSNEDEAPVSQPIDNTTENNLPVSPELPDVVVPKLVHTADIRFQVNELEKSSDSIDEAAKKYGGYVSTGNLSTTNTESNNTLTIRVPSQHFDALLKDICKHSTHMDKKNVSTQDVTEEHVDIEARLKSKREVLAKYEDILKNKAKTVDEVMKAEEQVRELREEIEAKEGRLNYLRNQVSYSTINVQLYQQIEYRENPDAVTETFGNKAKSGFGFGWNVVQGILLGMITVWPILLIGTIVFFVLRKKLRTV